MPSETEDDGRGARVDWESVREEARGWYVLVLLTVVSLTLGGCTIYFNRAAQRECGGDWSYETRCPPLTVCDVDEDVPLRGGHCVPWWTYVLGRR